MCFKNFLPACDRQGGTWRIFSLILRIAFQRNGEFFSRHVFLDDELFHARVGACQAFGGPMVERGRGWAKVVSDTGSLQAGINGIDIMPITGKVWAMPPGDKGCLVFGSETRVNPPDLYLAQREWWRNSLEQAGP